MHKEKYQDLNKKSSLNYLLKAWILMLFLLKKNIKILRIIRSKKLVLVWESELTHLSNKAKEFYLKNGIEGIEWHARSPYLNPIENISGLLKMSLIREKLTKKLRL